MVARRVQVELRAARPGDVPFIQAVFLSAMGGVIGQLFGWDERRQAEHFVEFFVIEETSIIVADGQDVGWLQEQSATAAINIGSLYIAPDAQRLGVGGTIVERVAERAASEGKAVTLAVVKVNPAVQFYLKHGFRVTHEDEYKYFMRRDG